MSSKIEVSRELLEQLASPYTGLRNQAMYALRALLAAPVVERQPVDMQWQYEAGSVWWSFDTDNVGDNIASGTKIRLIDHAGTVLFKYPVPELAELQAKCELSDIRISQLTVAIDQSSKAQLENYHMATRAWTESKELQATIERLNGELQAATDLITAKRSVNRTLRNEIERLKAGQGEPVSKQEAATLIASHLAPGRSEGHVAEVARAIIALASTTDNLF